MAVCIRDNVWSFQVVLPENPLKWLNCYAILGGEGGRDLLIDTGFRRPECLAALMAGMSELGMRPERTDVFLTHVHSDHTGNAPELAAMGYGLIMGRIDHGVLMHDTWPERKARALAEGMPEDVMRVVFEHNPAVLFAPGPFQARLVDDGDMLCYGGHKLLCLLTPGHTPGHMCLFEEDSGLLFLGDHVLFDITPNIIFWEELDDSLGAYITSLDRVKDLPVTRPLPGHRTVGGVGLSERVESILAHHGARLAEMEQVIRESPGLSAYDIAGRMTWRIRAKTWDDFPPGQKWFAMGEALAHLDYLVGRNRVLRRRDGTGHVHYFEA